MERSGPLLGPNARKLEPALRMAVDGSLEVNVARAEQAPAMAVEETPATREALAAQLPLEERVVFADRDELPAPPLPAVPEGVRTSVFIQTISPDVEARFPGQTARRGDLVLAELGLDELAAVLADPDVSWVESGEEVRVPQPDVATVEASAPDGDDPRAIDREDLHGGGERTLIGIIDVGGFDFAHPDFRRRGGGTRFERIWDQGGDTRPSPRSRNDGRRWDAFAYGSELRQAELDAAIEASGREHLPAWELEPQSQMVAGSHGTHVTSIAAGNRGVARQSPIAAVLISLPEDEDTRRRTFTDSSRIAHAVDYLCAVADEMGLPVSINISLGTNGHAHDGSSPTNRWIDEALTIRGRSVCIAAGNAGQEAPRSPGDPAYRTGRIHTSGTVAAAGLEAVIEWDVIGSGIRDDIVDVSENEFELWYGPQDRFMVTLQPPDGPPIGPVRPGQFIENRQRPDGTFVSIYNELYHPANGSNYIAVYLSPYLGSDRVAGISRGTWRVRLHGLDVRDGRYHAWIERDDFAGIWPRERPIYWRFPSSFGARSFVDSHTVTSLGCGQDTITVANLDAARESINVTSSQGPTRDGRSKPDVAAPGTDIVAANGFAGADEPWIAMTGTSMASPYVTGVVGLMLSTERELTAAQIEGIIQRTARPLPGSDYRWRDDAGFGVIDPVACVTEADVVNTAEQLQP